MSDAVGIICQICGHRMDAREDRICRGRWQFVCPHCGAAGPTAYGRGKAALAAKHCDMILRSKRREIQCPYYKGQGRQERVIKCESPQEAGAWVKIRYGDTRTQLRMMALYCRGRWRDCPIARANDDKYGKG